MQGRNIRGSTLIIRCPRASGIYSRSLILTITESPDRTRVSQRWSSPDEPRDALSADLSISVPDGYCFAGAMNVDFQFKKTELIHNALAEDGAAVAELADSMLDVGDVSAVTPQSKCPAGTVLFSGIHKKLIFDEHGDMHVNAAMCLQKCLDDGDCRADEGYSCIQWRDQNVCFHEETMQNLRKWEEEMGLVD